MSDKKSFEDRRKARLEIEEKVNLYKKKIEELLKERPDLRAFQDKIETEMNKAGPVGELGRLDKNAKNRMSVLETMCMEKVKELQDANEALTSKSVSAMNKLRDILEDAKKQAIDKLMPYIDDDDKTIH